MATSRERAFELADRYHNPHAAQRALDLAWASTQVELRELRVTPTEAAVFQELAGRLFYPSPSLRAPQAERHRNRGSQPLLWSIGLSGDWPILLAVIKSPDGLPTLREVMAAHRYWRRRGMMVDLAIVNTHPPTYLQELNDSIVSMLYALHASDEIDRPGGVFIRRLDQLGTEALLMLRASAPVHVDCDGRSLGDLLMASQVLTRGGGLVKPPGTPVSAIRHLSAAGLPANGAAGAQEAAAANGNGFGTMLPGGQLMITTEVENYPGFPEGITGPELMQKMKSQAERFGTRSRMEMVDRVDLSGRPMTLTLRGGDEVRTQALIVATGANAQWLGVPNEERLAQSGGGVSACAVCDAALPIYRNQALAVVGGGDSALVTIQPTLPYDALRLTFVSGVATVGLLENKLQTVNVFQACSSATPT